MNRLRHRWTVRLAAVLGLFLLDDADVIAARARFARVVPAALRRLAGRAARVAARIPRPPLSRIRVPPKLARILPIAMKGTAIAAAALFTAVSLADALLSFREPIPALSFMNPLLERNLRFHLANTYHLFASITRERIEPEIETLADGVVELREADDAAWTAQHLRHKPGDPMRAPDFVAPQQPRVDFRLWFYGLAFQRRPPTYVSTLAERLCEEPEAVQPLFRAPLPPHPAAVRLVFWQYQFTSRAEKKSTGAWWRRTRLATTRALPCPRVP